MSVHGPSVTPVSPVASQRDPQAPSCGTQVPLAIVVPQPAHHRYKRKRGTKLTWIVLLPVLFVAVAAARFFLLQGVNEQESRDAAQAAERRAAAAAAALQPKTERETARQQRGFFDDGDETAAASSELQPWKKTPRANLLLDNPFVGKQNFDPHTTIDELVQKRLAELDIKPAKLCSDEVFLRRVYIDTLGTLPTVEEAQSFLDDSDSNKRAKLINQVLERPEFADYSAMKWSDVLRVKAEFPIKLWPNAAQAYHRWIRTAIEQNVPFDQFARELLTASGSNFRRPQVNFYRALQGKDSKALAQAVALTFLGERTEQWPTERLDGMSAFFSQVGYKPTSEWKEEIVFFDRHKGKDSGSLNQPLIAVYPDGEQVQIPPGQDPRHTFADWLVQEKNPWFARVAANRVWYWLLGHGIVDPSDDMRADNPPSNPALLDHLAGELVTSRYDMKHLYRTILNSQTYQLSCVPGSQDSAAEKNFACYTIRRLDAEVLIDAICQITGTSEEYTSIIPEPFTFLPDGTRAIALPDGSITSSFLEMFGRPTRDTGLESDRNNHLSAAQALHLLNSNHLRNKLNNGPGIDRLLQKASVYNPADVLCLAILSRRPTDDERSLIADISGYGNGARDAAWVLVNTDEFLFRH
ncbi:MAG TPA: DUF1553 domain-containing protein [Planctomycetaceae bacterium]|nr:DUF1553 domain-containing protein [Planctomycetaceae bacterium]